MTTINAGSNQNFAILSNISNDKYTNTQKESLANTNSVSTPGGKIDGVVDVKELNDIVSQVISNDPRLTESDRETIFEGVLLFRSHNGESYDDLRQQGFFTPNIDQQRGIIEASMAVDKREIQEQLIVGSEGLNSGTNFFGRMDPRMLV